MTAGDLALVLAVILCAFGFAALVLVLARVLSALRALRGEIDALRRQTTPLIDDLRESADTAPLMASAEPRTRTKRRRSR